MTEITETPAAAYYSDAAFFDAWKRGVAFAGPRWFGDGDEEQFDRAVTKDDLAPRHDDIIASLGVLSSGEAAFLVALYSFYNAYTARDMWEIIAVDPMAGLAACLDEPRRRVIADLLISYAGW